VVLGLAHFVAGMLYVQGYYLPGSGLANRVLFIPLLLSLFSYLYAGAKYNQMKDREGSGAGGTAATLYMIVGIVVILGMIALEFLLPDAQTPLL